jgi:hypothetical protein
MAESGPSSSEMLEFEVRSGGTIAIEVGRCIECATRACVKVCATQDGPLVLNPEKQAPSLRWSLAEVKRGGCVECLGCELDCLLYGKRAVQITLPVPGLDECLASVKSVVHKAF